MYNCLFYKLPETFLVQKARFLDTYDFYNLGTSFSNKKEFSMVAIHEFKRLIFPSLKVPVLVTSFLSI